MSERRVATTLEPGTVLSGKYVVEEKLGGGGMGQVFRARQQPIGRSVALKLLHPKFVSDEEVEARFLREARAASQLHHPNTITIYDFGETSDGLYFIAMEYIDGEPLGEILDREGTLSLARTGPMIIQIAQSLGEAHRKGIIHRDLKPDNVMVIAEQDGSERVKVVDFGIAKVVDNTVGLTQTGSVFGTPGYMAPEQARGGEVEPSSDFYALTCLVYECLTGSLPYRGGSALETMMQHQTEPIPTLGDEYPDELDGFLKRGMAKHPSQRLQTADDYIAAFMSCFVEGEDPTPEEMGSGPVAAMDRSGERVAPTTPSSEPRGGTPTEAFESGSTREVASGTRPGVSPRGGVEAVQEVPSGEVGASMEKVTDSGPTSAAESGSDIDFRAVSDSGGHDSQSGGGSNERSSRTTGPGESKEESSSGARYSASQSASDLAIQEQSQGADDDETGSDGISPLVAGAVGVAMLVGGVVLGVAFQGQSDEGTAAASEPSSSAQRQLEVDTEPKGAVVKLDGNRAGVTPLELRVPEDEPVDITLEKEGFQSKDVEDVRWSEQPNGRLFASLERKTVEVVVTSPVGDAELTVGDQSFGRLPSGQSRTVEIVWPEGPLTVELDAPDYSRYVDRTPASAIKERIVVEPRKREFVPAAGSEAQTSGDAG